MLATVSVSVVWKVSLCTMIRECKMDSGHFVPDANVQNCVAQCETQKNQTFVGKGLARCWKIVYARRIHG